MQAVTLLDGGRLRVAKRHAPGREITLYLVEPGDLCVLEVPVVTHERLAQELGCAREAVSRAPGAWERGGIVRRGRGTLTVLDHGRLAALAEPGTP